MTDSEVDAAARLLLQHWDVVGVGDIDIQPEQEYRYEAQKVLRLLGDGADVSGIADYLGDAAADMSEADQSRDQAAAAALVEWYRNGR